jgi:3-oxoacyl-[acyl-carrier protein] reductase
MSRLQGKAALVTGSSRGIGRAIAERLARDGAAVVVNYAKNADSAKEVVAAITAKGGKAVAVAADMTKPDEIRRLIEQTVKQLGRLDILVNNAGVFEMLPLEKIDAGHFERLFRMNVMGPMLAAAAASPHLPDGGRIISISSGLARAPFANGAAYAATKAAIEAMTRCLAEELGPRHITVNAVAPGTTDTDMLRSGLPQEALDAMAKKTALGRLGEPGDIADVVAFVASDDARWITGQTIDATGGLKV